MPTPPSTPAEVFTIADLLLPLGVSVLFLAGWWRSRDTPVRIPVTWAASATLAWLIADAMHINPALAAVAALLSISFTPVSSLKQTFTDTAVLVAGMLTGIAFLDILGPHAWVAGLTALGGWGVAQLFGVSDSTAIKIPAGAIAVFAIGQIPSTDSVVLKIAALLLGGTIGVILSAIKTPNPIKTVERDLGELSQDTADLLSTIADNLHSATDAKAEAWSDTLATLTTTADQVRASVEEAQRTRAWSPFAAVADTGRLTLTINSLDHAHAQIRHLINVVRSEDASYAADPLKPVLDAAGAAFHARGATLTGEPAPLEHHVDTVADVSRDAVRHMRSIDDTQELLHTGALVGGIAHSVYGMGDPQLQQEEAPEDVLPALSKLPKPRLRVGAADGERE